MCKALTIVVALALTALAPSIVYAQASIAGVVKDASGRRAAGCDYRGRQSGPH